jgi:hypothetical protein
MDANKRESNHSRMIERRTALRSIVVRSASMYERLITTPDGFFVRFLNGRLLQSERCHDR